MVEPGSGAQEHGPTMPTGSFDRLPAFTDDEVVVVIETPKGSRNK